MPRLSRTRQDDDAVGSSRRRPFVVGPSPREPEGPSAMTRVLYFLYLFASFPFRLAWHFHPAYICGGFHFLLILILLILFFFFLFLALFYFTRDGRRNRLAMTNDGIHDIRLIGPRHFYWRDGVFLRGIWLGSADRLDLLLLLNFLIFFDFGVFVWDGGLYFAWHDGADWCHILLSDLVSGGGWGSSEMGGIGGRCFVSVGRWVKN